MEIQPRVTLKDLAEVAGVSRATVSFALRNDPRLRPQTCDRIQKLAVKMGYTPDPVVAHLLARLRASRTPKYQATIALLNTSPRQNVFAEVRTYGEWRDGAKRQAATLGYGVDEFWLFDPDMPHGRLPKILFNRGIRGALATPLFNEGVLPFEHSVLWKRLACVVIGKMGLEPSFHGSRNDQFATAKTAVLSAFDHGYRRPSLVLSPAVDRNVGSRFSGGFHAGLRLCPGMRTGGDFPFQWGDLRAFKRWISRHEPDVLITAHTEIMDWVKSLGLKVPQQIGLIHLDNNSGVKNWAGIDQQQELVGAAAVDILIGLLHQNHVGAANHPFCAVIPGYWKQGGTVRRIAGRSRKTTS